MISRAQIGRAAPTVLIAALTLLAAVLMDGPLVAMPAVVVFFQLLRMIKPDWWIYVKTGCYPIEEKYREPGDFDLRLLVSGPRPIEVLKAVREISDLTFAEAKRRVDDTPSVLAEGLSEASAKAGARRLSSAGGLAAIEEQ